MDEPGRPDELTEEVYEGESPKGVGSADELTDEVVAEATGEDKPKILPSRRRDSSAAGASTGRAAARRRPAKAPAAGKGKAMAVIAAVAVVATIAFFVNQGGGDENAVDGDPTPTEGGSEGSKSPLSPAKEFAKRLRNLDDGDLAGRQALATYGVENMLTEPTRELQLEILLLDPDDAAARGSLGFTRYDGGNGNYDGLWLDEDDLRIAQSESR